MVSKIIEWNGLVFLENPSIPHYGAVSSGFTEASQTPQYFLSTVFVLRNVSLLNLRIRGCVSIFLAEVGDLDRGRKLEKLKPKSVGSEAMVNTSGS